MASCPQCGAPVDSRLGRCADGHEVTSEHLIGVASTIDNAAHEVARRSGRPEDSGDHTNELDPLIGKKFGKYDLVDVIGRGGMGAVYKARHEELGHFAAIKVIERRLVGSQDTITRLFREARAAAQIGHANIVQVHDFGRDPDIGGYIVMEYLQGSSLEDTLGRERRLDEGRALAIALEVCDALSAAHEKGIVHRDLKPANVFLQKTSRGELAKVMDFGIAKVAASLGESATQPGTILGTPRYMSPEQWCSEPVDARSDIYSFGVMLYRMTTGALPNPKATSLPQLARVVTQKVQPAPREVNPNLSAAMEAIILKCCEPERSDRYASMEEVAEALRALATDESRSARPTRGSRGRALGVAAVIVAVLAGGGLLATLRKTDAYRAAAFTAARAGVPATTAPPAVSSLSSAVPPEESAKPAPPAVASAVNVKLDAGAPVRVVAPVATPRKPPAPVAPPASTGKKQGDLLFGE